MTKWMGLIRSRSSALKELEQERSYSVDLVLADGRVPNLSPLPEGEGESLPHTWYGGEGVLGGSMRALPDTEVMGRG